MKLSHSLRYIVLFFLLTLCVVVWLSLFVRVVAFFVTLDSSHEEYDYGIVLGASVYQNGSLSDVLQDRVDGALAWYRSWDFERFFVSGDDTQEHHEEVESIIAYLREHGVDDADIVADCVWVDTYDSLRRAKNVYGIDNGIVYTQHFHLSRVLYLGHFLGIDMIGVPVQRKPYKKQLRFEIREVGAQMKAVYDTLVRSRPVFESVADCVHE